MNFTYDPCKCQCEYGPRPSPFECDCPAAEGALHTHCDDCDSIVNVSAQAVIVEASDE